METVYIETSIISYLAARPSRDIIVAGHQAVSYAWWHEQRKEFACYVSQVVLDEAGAGDPEQACIRMQLVADLPVIEVTPESEFLAIAIMKEHLLPPRAVRDAAHIAVAAVSGMDYLLTWNCAHLANAQIVRRIAVTCAANGYSIPFICTPEVLMGENYDA
jgi:predicted nucleic acid-binding protein